MSVVVDTSALYALLARTDRGHDQLRQAFFDVARSGRPMYTTSRVELGLSASPQRTR